MWTGLTSFEFLSSSLSLFFHFFLCEDVFGWCFCDDDDNKDFTFLPFLSFSLSLFRVKTRVFVSFHFVSAGLKKNEKTSKNDNKPTKTQQIINDNNIIKAHLKKEKTTQKRTLKSRHD